jgi:hypothetical protein
VVVVEGEEFVVECRSVREDARSQPRPGQFHPAGGGDATDVTVYALEGLDSDIIAVSGPAEALCAGATVPGSGVAFDLTTDLETVQREIEPLTVDP